jgi:hypothetical chaperone protein
VRKLGIGIDFGTTNSAAAIYDGEMVLLVQLEADNSIMPSATYIDANLQAKTGQAAIDQYIADNTGRTVELIPEVVAEVSQFVEHGEGGETNEVETSTQKIYGAAVTDAGMQGRLFRGTKRLLGDERVRRLMVFNHPFRLVALITPLLLRMHKSLVGQVGNVSFGHLGHPVNFEGRSEHRNKLALSRLGEAYKYAGITEQHFYPEPIAAAVSYLHGHPAVQGDTLLTVDFGGGTLDLCVLRRRQQGFDVIATHGIGLGGDHIDQLLFRELLFPLLGEGEMWRRRGFDKEQIETRFPFEDFADLLLNWAVTYTLNQNKYTTPVMECIEQGGPAKRKFERLRDVIKNNLSYLLFARIKDFKAQLSTAEHARLDIPEIDVDVTLSREEFESLIAEPLQQVGQAVDTTLQQARMTPGDIDIVLRTGGSSLIPAVTALLDERFPGSVVSHDPFTSVATGLAVASFQGLNFP